MKRFAQRSIGLVAAAVVLAAAWFFLAPPIVGGGTSYVVLKGTSMAPHYRGGDLVLVRRRGKYGVGQIVAYRSDLLQHVVMHRIVGVHAGRYSFKGDNNDFVDDAHPASADLIGREWARIPRAGSAVAWLAAPSHAPLVGAIAALLLLWGSVAPTVRRRRRHEVKTPVRQEPALAAVPIAPPRAVATEPATTTSQRFAWVADRWRAAGITAVALGAAAALFGLVAFSAYGRPAETTASIARAYELKGTFSYAATARRNPVYPSGRIATGDPIFMRLVPNVSLRFATRFASRLPHAVRGSVAMRAVLQSPQGWTRSFPLEAPRRFRGDQASVTGTLRIDRLQALVRRFQVLTGVSQSTYTLTVVPTVSVVGTVAGADVRTQFAPSLALAVDPVEVRIAPPDLAGSGPAPNPLIAEQAGTVERAVPAHLSFLGMSATIAGARRGSSIAALVALALGLLSALVAFLGRRSRKPDEAERIARRYGDMVVPVDAVGLMAHGNVVDVSSIERLVQIAERYDAVILHERVEGVDAYLLEQGGTLYRYRSAKDGRLDRPAREDGVTVVRA